MSDDKNRRQQMVPRPDRFIEHGQQPTVFEKPPRPPQGRPANGGIANANAADSGDAS